VHLDSKKKMSEAYSLR